MNDNSKTLLHQTIDITEPSKIEININIKNVSPGASENSSQITEQEIKKMLKKACKPNTSIQTKINFRKDYLNYINQEYRKAIDNDLSFLDFLHIQLEINKRNHILKDGWLHVATFYQLMLGFILNAAAIFTTIYITSYLYKMDLALSDNGIILDTNTIQTLIPKIDGGIEIFNSLFYYVFVIVLIVAAAISIFTSFFYTNAKSNSLYLTVILENEISKEINLKNRSK